MRYLYQPTPQGIATVRVELETHVHDPDRYWPVLVQLLQSEHETTVDAHRSECTRDDCRTCQHLARVQTVFDAHDTVQPTECACPDHIVYPRHDDKATTE